MQIVPRKIAVFAKARLYELNPNGADLISLNQLQQAIEFGVTTVMSGPDAPQPQHGKILAAAARVAALVSAPQHPVMAAGRQQAEPTAQSLANQIREAFADTDPVALSQLLKENGNV